MSGRLRERMEERLPRRLEELSNLYGVSGDEGRVRRYLKDRLAGLEGLTMKTDTMGSLIVHRRGDGPRVMVCAHMDEVGFLIRGALDNGLLVYDQKGIDPRVAVSKRVAVGKAELPGVIGAKAIHLQTREDLKKALPHEELFIDIGARNKEEALELVKPGESACFTTKFDRLGENIVKGKALDDRSCWKIPTSAIFTACLRSRRSWDSEAPRRRYIRWPPRWPWCWRPPRPMICQKPVSASR